MEDFKRFKKAVQYIYADKKDETPHPFHVKSTLKQPRTQSVALESFLDEVKLQISEAAITKPRDNLNKVERKALKTLKSNENIILKKADKGTTTVIMNRSDKIQEGQIQLNDTKYYQPLNQANFVQTASRVKSLIQELYDNNFIDEKTMEWLLQTPEPLRIPEFYTLTKFISQSQSAALLSQAVRARQNLYRHF